jgi:putative ABC transport system permease protein
MNNTKLGAFTLGGINFTEMQEMLPERFHLMQGHFPTAEENKSIVLGYKAGILNDTVLANVGDNITLTLVNKYGVYNETFEVAGILEKGGTSGITNFDYWAFIPIETALQIPGVEGYQILLAKVSDTKYSEQVAKEIESKFKQYSITVFVPSSLMRQVDNILNIVQLFLMAIASISLLVAGVGIMNIMTVAVMERTREIGILKAIGAKSRTVLGMFLAEAALIGIMGGLIGVFVGYGLSYGLANVLSNFIQPSRQNTGVVHVPETERMTITPVFSLEWTIVAFIFAITVCIIFGLYPARKAAKLNPVEALRYE